VYTERDCLLGIALRQYATIDDINTGYLLFARRHFDTAAGSRDDSRIADESGSRRRTSIDDGFSHRFIRLKHEPYADMTIIIVSRLLLRLSHAEAMANRGDWAKNQLRVPLSYAPALQSWR
jgi:hypothetical protein